MNERATVNMPNQIQMMLNGSIPPPPIAKLIGFKLVSISSGKAAIEFEADEKHTNPMGTLHGGVLCDISDAAMGMAYASRLKEGESFTTLELKINFLKTGLEGQTAGRRQRRQWGKEGWTCDV